jgi:hypothetical protein
VDGRAQSPWPQFRRRREFDLIIDKLGAIHSLLLGGGTQGVFIMEYCDFLGVFEVVERTQLFDTSWVQSTHWLNVRSRPLGSSWQFGDVSCESVP